MKTFHFCYKSQQLQRYCIINRCVRYISRRLYPPGKYPNYPVGKSLQGPLRPYASVQLLASAAIRAGSCGGKCCLVVAKFLEPSLNST